MAVLFSQHSSNPLEDRSSDVRNKAFHDVYAKQPASSDDPLRLVQMEDYWRHIAAVRPEACAVQDEKYGDRSVLGMDTDQSDDELRIGGDDHTPVKMEEPEEMDVANEESELSELSEENDADVEEDDEDNVDESEQVPSGSDEEHSLSLKPPEEQDEIILEIADLEMAVPALSEDYKLVDRLGTGTFSSVYKAIDLHYHSKWDNSVWHGNHPPSSSAYYQSARREPDSKVFVAIKRIYVTSSPERIRNEIAIMDDCRGCRHVSQLITAFRQDDQVVAVMPYQRNDDFRDYYRTLPLPAIKSYFRCLFRALRDIHARGVIHRDVKPANFLYDSRTGVGTLCDFGLACRMEPGPSHNQCLHTPPTFDVPHGRHKSGKDYDRTYMKEMYKQARIKSQTPADRVGYLEKDTRPQAKTNRAGTRGFRAPEVLLKCGDQSGAIDVWAAGMILLFFLTDKFPLFQSNDDTEALMEIAAIIGKKKMETVAILHGKTFSTNVPAVGEPMPWIRFVEKNNPDVYTPPDPDPQFYPYSQTTFTRAYLTTKHRPPPESSSSSSPSSRSSSMDDTVDEPHHRLQTSSPATTPVPPDVMPISQEAYTEEIKSAISLLENLMEPDCTKRYTPRDALYHPFLVDDQDLMQDDDYFPHQFGKGVCSKFHFRDPVTEEPCVKVLVRDSDSGEEKLVVKTLCNGEGIAIGNEACEFHRDMV